jgi:hypothetical protein
MRRQPGVPPGRCESFEKTFQYLLKELAFPRAVYPGTVPHPTPGDRPLHHYAPSRDHRRDGAMHRFLTRVLSLERVGDRSR